MKLSGWGRYPIVEASLIAPRKMSEISEIVRSSSSIARGNGRAYGDSAIGSNTTIHMKHFNRILSFDKLTGQITVEAGVILGDIIEVCLPHGWFPAVTPGTRYVTVGGMIAADVHGKNHHKDGSFRNFVEWIDVICEDGEVKRCSAERNGEMFDWTIGGMGLTGIIIRIGFRLRRVETGWIRQQTLVARNIDEAIEQFEAHLDSTYSVAWIDTASRGHQLGRSLLTLGEHACLTELDQQCATVNMSSPRRKQKSINFDLPNWVLNKASIRAFNGLYFLNGSRRAKQCFVSWDKYFILSTRY